MPWLFGVLMSACAGSPTGDDSAALGPEVHVGTGADTWEPLAEGDPLTMVHGPQGGWHLLGSLWVANEQGVVTVHFTVDTDAGIRVADNLYTVQLASDPRGGGVYPGMYAYLYVQELAEGEADTPPELLADTTLHLRMEVLDEAQRTGWDEVRVKAALDPADE